MRKHNNQKYNLYNIKRRLDFEPKTKPGGPLHHQPAVVSNDTIAYHISLPVERIEEALAGVGATIKSHYSKSDFVTN